jgi:hypothetical protein
VGKVKPIGFGGVDAIRNGEVMAGIRQTKKLGASCGLGMQTLGRGQIGDSVYAQGVYQRRVTGYNRHGRNPNRVRKTYYVKMRTYAPTNPRTPAQQANRQKLLDANQAWKDLTPVEKSRYNSEGKRRNKIGRMVHHSWYLKNH